MELTTKGRYAVMAMADIAHRTTWASPTKPESDHAVPLSQVADRQHISLAYLEQLFLKLRRAELVESARGRTGGYRLSRAPETIAIRDILTAVEEETSMTRCGAGGDEAPCVAGQRCMTHDLWTALGNHIDAFLMDVTLADVINGRFSATTKAMMRREADAAVLRATGHDTSRSKP